MTHFTSHAERLHADSQELLEVPAVSERLGDYALRLSSVVDRLTPTYAGHEDFLELDDISIDAIPLISRQIGERAIIHADDSHMNSAQLRALSAKIGADKARTAERKTKQYFHESQSHRELSLFEGMSDLALTGSNFWVPTKNTLVYGRPYLSMNIDAAPQGRLSPVAALHELTHVIQKEDTPIATVESLARDKIRKELEAYYVAAQIILGMKDMGRQRELLAHTPQYELEKALRVESARRGSQQSIDPFDPNNRVVESLVDDGLNVTAEVGRMIRARAKT